MRRQLTSGACWMAAPSPHGSPSLRQVVCRWSLELLLDENGFMGIFQVSVEKAISMDIFHGLQRFILRAERMAVSTPSLAYIAVISRTQHCQILPADYES